MTDAMHLAEELSARYLQDRRAFDVLAISDPAYLSCAGNDWGFDRIFARGVEAWTRAGDMLAILSTSGNSPNVVAAARSARARGVTVIGLLGRDGGQVLPLCDEAIVVPSAESARVQEVHIKLVHLLVEGIERIVVPEHYAGR
jgi:D-sedoheptulose 7-phosphate isomerase